MVASYGKIASFVAKAALRDMKRRGDNVVNAAKKNLEGGSGYPRRIDTGALQRSIHASTLASGPRRIHIRVLSMDRKARWIHDGTGIYGPRRKKIVPVRARALVFRSRRFGQRSGKFRGFVVASSVKGMKPTYFLKRALSAARD